MNDKIYLRHSRAREVSASVYDQGLKHSLTAGWHVLKMHKRYLGYLRYLYTWFFCAQKVLEEAMIVK